MAKTWRAGVIGCGAIAQALHLPGYRKTLGVELVAACDPAVKQRKDAERIGGPGLRTYSDYRKMLEAEDLDVVSVCSPNVFHTEHACAALGAGAHVLLEKPIAISMQEAGSIRRAVKRSGRGLIVGFSHRFHRGNRRLHVLIGDGAIGAPYMFRMRLAHTGPLPGWARSDWFYKPKLAGGGALLDMGIHAIDQALWHMGPVAGVQGRVLTMRKKIAVDDNAVLLLEFARGRAMGYIEVGWTSPSGFGGIEVMGDEGSAKLDYHGNLTLTTGRASADTKAPARMKTRILDRAPTTGGWSTEIQDVVKALRRGDDLGIGIDAGAAALEVALAGYASSRSGRRVDLPVAATAKSNARKGR